MADESAVPEWDPDKIGIEYRYVAMADHLELRIRAGEFKANAPLPGERALCEMYGVALGTTRNATSLLRDRGLVKTLPGRGSFVRPREEWPADE